MTDSITVVLPLPGRNLQPNRPTHWVAKAKAVRKARDDAHWAATHAMLEKCWKCPPKWHRAHVIATFYFPDKRRRDPINFLASCKAYLDGIVDAGLLADDDELDATTRKAIDRDDPRVELEFREVAS